LDVVEADPMKIERFEEEFTTAAPAWPVVRKHQRLDDFLRGPMCARWLDRATAGPKAAIKVGHALWQEVGMNKDNFLNEGLSQSREIRVHQNLRKRRGLSRSTVSRGLKALVELGLIAVVNQGPGKQPTVVIRNISVLPHSDNVAPF
jgi:DNA-binding transcriptional ArsR family regulator